MCLWGGIFWFWRNESSRKFQLSYNLEECVGAGTDIVGYCYKTNTAFYEWHHSGTSYFLSPKK